MIYRGLQAPIISDLRAVMRSSDLLHDEGVLYEVCSLASSNETADDLPGPGRTLGKLYGFLGQRIESGLGRAAERMGYGPKVTALKIQRLQRGEVLLSASARRKQLEKNCKRLVRYVG